VWPHSEAEEAHSAGFTHRLDLVEVATGFGASLVEVLQRSAGQLELAGGFQADGAVVAAHRDDLAAFLDRLPAELAQLHQNVTDTARLVIARSAMIVALVDQLLVLGADPPAFRRLLAGLERCDELLPPFDPFFFPARPRARAHAGPLGEPRHPRQRKVRAHRYQSPAIAIHSAVAAIAAVSPRRMRGPRLMGRAWGSARTAARSASSNPPSGPISKAAAPLADGKALAAGSPPSSSAKNSVRSAGQSRNSA